MTLVRLALACALLLTACTDGGSSGGAEAPQPVDVEAAVTRVLEEGFTASSPEQCSTLYTETGLTEALGTVGGDREADLARCEELLVEPTSDAKSVVVEVEVLDDRSANAVVTPDGGSYAGLALHLAMVEQDGWRIDAITRQEMLDRTLVEQQWADSVQGSVGSLYNQPSADCMKQVAAGKTDTDIERLLADDAMVDLIAEAVVTCVGLGVDSVAVGRITAYQLKVKAEDIPAVVTDCASGGVMLRDFTVKGIMTDPDEAARWNDATLEEAQECLDAGVTAPSGG